MSSIGMSEQIENHADGRSRIALIALDGVGGAWVQDGGSEDPSSWTVPSTTRERDESVVAAAQRVAATQIGGRVRCLQPHQAVSGVSGTAFFVGWIPGAVLSPVPGLRRCLMEPKGLPPELKRALGKDAHAPDVVPYLRALATLNELWRLGYRNLTLTTWTDEQGWHMEIIPTSLISLHGHSFIEIMSSFKESETLRADTLTEWHRDLAVVGQEPIIHHGAANPDLFGLGPDRAHPRSLAKRLTRERLAACMAGYGHADHYQSRWVPNPEAVFHKAQRDGLPILRWEGSREVTYSWAGLEDEP